MKQQRLLALLITAFVSLFVLSFGSVHEAEAQDGVPIQISGIVESVNETTLVLSGQSIDIASAELLPELRPGMQVVVSGRLLPDGRIIAENVFLLDQSAVTPAALPLPTAAILPQQPTLLPVIQPTITPAPVLGTCPRDSRFWSSSSDNWPVRSLMLGAQNYSAAELLLLLNTPVNGDASRRLARSLIVAKLNIADGTSPQPIVSAVSEADLLLNRFAGNLPYNILPNDELGLIMITQAEMLDSYNTGLLLPACVAVTPVPVGTGLTGEYFDNEDLTVLLFTRIDPVIDFNWGREAPRRDMGSATFSERWTGYVVPLYSETYTFHTYSDDGVRLWVNDEPLIDDWTRDAPTQNRGTIALQAGQPYAIRLEHFQNGGGALIQLSWSSVRQPLEIIPQSQLIPADGLESPTPATNVAVAQSGGGLTGEYFDEEDLTESLFVRIDPEIDFNWRRGAPAPGMGTETFSVRWTGYIVPEFSETYTFYTYSDDGVRLWVNDRQIINNWTRHNVTENHGSIALQAGQPYAIRLEYYEDGMEALIQLTWSSAQQPEEIISASRLIPASGGSIVPLSTPPAGFGVPPAEG